MAMKAWDRSVPVRPFPSRITVYNDTQNDSYIFIVVFVTTALVVGDNNNHNFECRM